MQKRILLSLLLGVIFSISIFSQNLKVEKITLPDSELTNLYKIDSGVYRSEQPSHEDFKALEKYGIGEALNLRNRHSDDDEAAGTNVKLHRVKRRLLSIAITDQIAQELFAHFIEWYFRMFQKKTRFMK